MLVQTARLNMIGYFDFDTIEFRSLRGNFLQYHMLAVIDDSGPGHSRAIERQEKYRAQQIGKNRQWFHYSAHIR